MPPLDPFDFLPREVYEQGKAYLAEKASAAVEAVTPALSYLERPAAAARGFLGTPEDRTGGFARGLQYGSDPDSTGQAVPSGFDLLKPVGLPTDNIGPLPFSPADVAGRAAELATDPLTWIPGVGQAARGAGVLGTGLKLTRPFAGDLAMAIPDAARMLRKPAPTLAEAVGRSGPALGDVAGTLAANTQDTLGREIGLTKVGTLLASPKAGDAGQGIDAIMHASIADATKIEGRVKSLMAPIRNWPITAKIRDAVEGTLSGLPGGRTLTADEANQVALVKRVLGDAEDLHRTTWEELNAVAPELAAQMKIDYLDNYFPGYIEQVEGGVRRKVPVGAKRGFEQPKSYPNHAAGEAAGEKYLTPTEEIEKHLAEQAQRIVDMQTLTMLAKHGYATDLLPDAADPLLLQLRALADKAISGAIIDKVPQELATAFPAETRAIVNLASETAKLHPMGADLASSASAAENVSAKAQTNAARGMQRQGLTPSPTTGFQPQNQLAALLRTPNSPAANTLPSAGAKARIPGDLNPGESVLYGTKGAFDVRTNPDTEALKSLRDSVQSQISDLFQARKTAKAAQDAATAGKSLIPGTTYKGLWFDPEDAAKIGNYMGREKAFTEDRGVGRALSVVSDTVSSIRTDVAALDMSYSFLQNLTMLAAHPAIGLATVVKGFQDLADPKTWARFMASPEVQDTVSRIPIHIGGTELTKGEGLIGKLADKTAGIPGVGRVTGAAAAAIDRTQHAWDTMGDVARVHAASALKNLATDPATAGQIADVVNHMTGYASSRAMGVGPRQRAAETGLLFAPNYMRASLALVGDLLHGQVARSEAAHALGSMAVAGAYLYQHISDALGQTPVWDPADSKFMTFDVGGNRIGIGGTYRGLMNLMGKVAASPDKLGGDNWNGLDPENDNPLIKFWRGRGSIPVSKIFDIATKETFNGSPIDENFPSLVRWAGTSFLPFAIAGLINERGNPTSQALGVGAQGLGLRSFPEPRTDIQDRIATERFGRAFAELNPIEKAQVNQADEIKALPPMAGARGERSAQLGGVFDEWQTGVEKAAAQLANKEMSGNDFRKTVNILTNTRNDKLDMVPDPKRPKVSDDPMEQKRQQWIALLQEEDAYGRKDFNRADAFLDTLTAAERTYFDQKTAAGLEQLSPAAKSAMTELRAARETLKPYRETLETKLRAVGLLDQWLAANPAERDKLEATSRFKTAERLAGVQKEALRKRNRAVDKALVDWYGLKTIAGR